MKHLISEDLKTILTSSKKLANPYDDTESITEFQRNHEKYITFELERKNPENQDQVILEDEDDIEVSDNEDIDVALKVIHDKEIFDEDDDDFVVKMEDICMETRQLLSNKGNHFMKYV